MSRNGAIDWGFGELLGARHRCCSRAPRCASPARTRAAAPSCSATPCFHDRENGQEWLPLANLQRQPGAVLRSTTRCSASTRRWASSTATRSSGRMRSCSGRPSSATSPTAPRSSSTSSSPRAEQKWGQRSGLVLLLPHGYEGQGPDHSSARIERFLQLCAENNMTVARPSTPASYFHLLRRQAYARPRRPLVVFTPKAMLRLRGATSEVADFTHGKFEPVLDDARDRRQVGRAARAAHCGQDLLRPARRAREAPGARGGRPRAARAVLPAARRRAAGRRSTATRTPSWSGRRTSPRTRARGRSSSWSS